jgi:alpha-beta hydrolase superfamily lysophospholipase
MEKEKKKRRWRSLARWIGWVVFVQFLLFNISAALYADKFTRFHSPEENGSEREHLPAGNVFVKTWRLFSGNRYYKVPYTESSSIPFVTVRLFTKEKIPVEAWLKRPDSSRGTVILFHGLMGNKSSLLYPANEFLNSGYTVMLVDVRGHGNSGGQTTTVGFRETEEVKLAYDYMREQGEKTIFLWGLSMGAVEIIKAMADYDIRPSGLILEMPFGSLQAHVRGRMRTKGFPEQPFAFFITCWIGIERGFNALGFRLDKYAKKINCPVLLQYGSKDQLVNRDEVDDIYNAITSPQKKLVIYEDAYHESLLQKDPVTWRREVDDFLGKND